MTVHAVDLLLPRLRSLLDELSSAVLFDAQTHVGEHDPSGFTARWEEVVLAVLRVLPAGRALSASDLLQCTPRS